MARAATTADVFNAVAEPMRREILDLLAQGERPVNDQRQALKPIHDWVERYEDLWTERFRSLDAVVEELKREAEDDDGGE